MLTNALAAAGAVASAGGLSISEIAQGLNTFSGVGSRLNRSRWNKWLYGN